MLASKLKQEDREELVSMLDTLSTALVMYERTQAPRLEPIIQDLNEQYEALKKKIESYDYTSDQKTYDRITRHLDEVFGRVKIKL